MSYDVTVVMKRCLHRDNYTYNCAPMFEEALGEDGLQGLSNMSYEEAMDTLYRGLRDMEIHKDKYIKLNPENGWGNYDGALKFLKGIYKAMLISDTCYIEID